MSNTITTITFFRFPTLTGKFWALQQMQFAPSKLSVVSGLQFFKLLGSGKDPGFSAVPDWSVYALLGVWENELAASTFFDSAPIFRAYCERSSEQWTIYMRVRQSKGLWSGRNPFEASSQITPENSLFGVITRASIRPSQLLKFWRYVPTSQVPIQKGCEGLLFTKGIGELPFLQMATFSLWSNLDALKQFAYHSAEHRVAIEKTHKHNWYSEELFARFQPYRYEGSWQGLQLPF
jgi:hypothetical protein